MAEPGGATLPATPAEDQVEAPARRSSAWRRLRRDRVFLVAAGVLVTIGLAAIFAGHLTPYDPYKIDLRARLQPPSAEHWFGTDEQGRDLFTRVLFGLRLTLTMGFSAVLLGGLAGGLLGLLAAFNRRAGSVIMRLVDVLLSFPEVLLGLAIAALITPGVGSIVLALSIATVAPVARVARSAALSVMTREYIEAARAVGLSRGRIFWRYVTLNAASPIFIFLTLRIGQVILIGAALSFLGLGAQPPTAELGTMASQGRTFLFFAPHVSTIPCAVIFVMVLAFNLIGDSLRDAIDPRLQ